MVSEIHFWNNLNRPDKLKIISTFLDPLGNNEKLLDYFDDFNNNLSKKNLNFYLKSVINH